MNERLQAAFDATTQTSMARLDDKLAEIVIQVELMRDHIHDYKLLPEEHQVALVGSLIAQAATLVGKAREGDRLKTLILSVLKHQEA